LRLGVGLPKQLNGIIIVRAPGSTSSAAPVSTGVRPCGLSVETSWIYNKYISVNKYFVHLWLNIIEEYKKVVKLRCGIGWLTHIFIYIYIYTNASGVLQFLCDFLNVYSVTVVLIIV
jgi:hypothetical protein